MTAAKHCQACGNRIYYSLRDDACGAYGLCAYALDGHRKCTDCGESFIGTFGIDNITTCMNCTKDDATLTKHRYWENKRRKSQGLPTVGEERQANRITHTSVARYGASLTRIQTALALLDYMEGAGGASPTPSL